MRDAVGAAGGPVTAADISSIAPLTDSLGTGSETDVTLLQVHMATSQAALPCPHPTGTLPSHTFPILACFVCILLWPLVPKRTS